MVSYIVDYLSGREQPYTNDDAIIFHDLETSSLINVVTLDIRKVFVRRLRVHLETIWVEHTFDDGKYFILLAISYITKPDIHDLLTGWPRCFLHLGSR